MPRQNKEKKVAIEESVKGVTKPNTQATKKRKAKKVVTKDESSDSEFSFEEGTDNESTELSSSGTDEFAAGKANLAFSVDEKLVQQMKEETSAKKKSVLEIKHSDPRGVIYIGHLPFGFAEPQLKTFFSQFGEVTQIRVARSKKTQRSQNYGFIEFLDPIVAQIVSDTMDGYLMFTKMLVCKVIPSEKVHPQLFQHGKRMTSRSLEKLKHAKWELPNQRVGQFKRALEAEEKKRTQLKALGIEYNFPGYAAQAAQLTPEQLAKVKAWTPTPSKKKAIQSKKQ